MSVAGCVDGAVMDADGASLLPALPDDVLAVVAASLDVESLVSVVGVCRAWRTLRSREALWRAVWAQRPLAAAPRRPRGELFALLLRAEAQRRRRDAVRHDELLRQAYVGFCKRDGAAPLRALLSRFAAPLNVNHAHSLLEGNTLMNLAARCGALNCVRELHARGAALDAADWGGFTPLINAAWRGDANMVRWLVGAGADLTQRGTSQGQGPFTAAEWAVRRGHGHVYTLLRQAEAARRDDEAATTLGVAPTPKKRRSA